MQRQFSGTGTALVTPFTANGAVDYNALERVINFNINNGVNYLVSLGTTGETPTLSLLEQTKVLEFTIEKVAGRVKVIAGFGGNNTTALIDRIGTYHFNNVDAILSASPSYNKPTQEGIYQHYKAIAEVAPKPIILYNVPGRTASNISAETTLLLANDFENIIGVKEASGDMMQIMTIVRDRPNDFTVLSGDDLLTLPLLSFGVDGVISVLSNAFPMEFSKMVRKALGGEWDEAKQLHLSLIKVIDLLFKEGNPAGVKAALQLKEICEPHVRLPLMNASDSLTNELKKAISELG